MYIVLSRSVIAVVRSLSISVYTIGHFQRTMLSNNKSQKIGANKDRNFLLHKTSSLFSPTNTCENNDISTPSNRTKDDLTKSPHTVQDFDLLAPPICIKNIANTPLSTPF